MDGGDLLFKVNLDTGKIEGWPEGNSCDCSFKVRDLKVRDRSVYKLCCADREVVASDYYVPIFLPGGFGDYLDFKVLSDGRLVGFRNSPDMIVQTFFDSGE
jgi:hypothetical protein